MCCPPALAASNEYSVLDIGQAGGYNSVPHQPQGQGSCVYVDTRQAEDQGNACICLDSTLGWKTRSACSRARAYEASALILDGWRRRGMNSM